MLPNGTTDGLFQRRRCCVGEERCLSLIAMVGVLWSWSGRESKRGGRGGVDG